MTELKWLLKQYLLEDTAEALSKIMNKEMLILITGKHGKTGKTTLCRELRRLGV